MALYTSYVLYMKVYAMPANVVLYAMYQQEMHVKERRYNGRVGNC